jgi:CelD/BcsL family acetyltransferase involved in cellulose biosynthesis
MYAFQGGHDAACDVTSPGLVLRALILRDEVFGRGLTSYDFLDGAEAYKSRWTSAVRRLFDVEVHHPGLAGRVGCVLLGAPHLLRDLLRPRRTCAWEAFGEDAS